MEEEYSGGVVKKFLYVNRRAPHGSIYALESLETVLIGAAFDQDVSMLFIDDGVYQLKKDQQPDGIEFKNFSKAYRALEMYDVEKLYVEKESLAERGLTEGDLLVDIELVERSAVKDLVDSQDVILSF
ncbi:MAG: sulfurtransferase complex subunit TusC [Gammaproteobacteria bacterium]|nr:sulfurtransferase complex subunit TusC [Gammaproteobacteria bacterium]